MSAIYILWLRELKRYFRSRAQMVASLGQPRGIDRGALPRAVSLDVAIALLLGPMLYGNVLKLVTGRTPDRMPERVVDAFLVWCGAGPKTSTRSPSRARRGQRRGP